MDNNMAPMQPKLHSYQELVKNFLLRTPKAGVFLDVGFGKTLVTLVTLQELAAQNKISGHILVIAPKAIARSVWIDEMQKWGIYANVTSLIVNEKGKALGRKNRLELYDKIATAAPSFYFINRELVKDLVDYHIQNKRKWPFPTVVIDELQSFKSHSSERFKALKKVSPYISRFIGLTGTPTPNGLMDLWSEVYLMDMGKRLGKTITEYRQRYFYPGLTINGNVVDWKLRAYADKDIYDSVKDIVISVKNPNIKLPDVTYNNIYCYMDDKETKLYKKLLKEQVLDLMDGDGNDISVEAANAAVLSAKLAQMASGTLYINGNTEYVRIHNRKLEILEYIIQNTTSPVIVAYHYKCDKKEITDYLKKSMDIDVETMDGSPDMIHRWNNGEIPVMLLQPASVGHGLNLQKGGHTIIWYTVPTSLEEYIQCNGRVARQGQTEPVTIHHILTHGTVDKHLRDNIDKKDMSERQLMNAVSSAITDAGY